MAKIAVDVLRIALTICCCCMLTGSNDQSGNTLGWSKDKYIEEAKQTFDLIFHRYNIHIRPPQAVIDIEMKATLKHVRHLDIRKQELQVVLDVEMNWKDSRLQWYPKRIFDIIVNTSQIWRPDVVYTNAVSPPQSLYSQSVKVFSNGAISWTKRERVTTFCSTQLDQVQQQCNITAGFMSDSRGTQEDRVFSNTSSFSVPDPFPNHMWRLEKLYREPSNETRPLKTLDIELILVKKNLMMSDNKNKENNNNMDKDTGENNDDMPYAVFEEEITQGNTTGKTLEDGGTNSASRQLTTIVPHLMWTAAVVIVTDALRIFYFLR